MGQWSKIVLGGIVGIMLIFGCATTKKDKKVADTHPQFETLCSKCHTLDRVQAAHEKMPKEDMHKIVTRMAKKPNSGIDMSEINHIVEEIY